jgi:branched-chain amino acid transport system substrate-binding protein
LHSLGRIIELVIGADEKIALFPMQKNKFGRVEMRQQLGTSSGIHRRTLLKGAAASGLAASGVSLFNVARAASNTIKIGYISLQSGIKADFGQADPFVVDLFKSYVKDGLKIGGKIYNVEFVVRDDQSDPNRAVEIGNELILRQQCDLMLSSDLVASIPVGNLADAQGVPMISTMGPWQGWMFPRGSNPGKGFPYSFHFFWGAEDVLNTFIDMWSSVKTNRTVGTLFADEPGGRAFGDPQRGLPALLAKAEFKEVASGFFQLGSDDFSNQVATFKNAKADIISGFCWPKHWATLWRQAAQAGYKPEVCTVAGTFLFPTAVAALGNGDGMSTEVWWTPNFPFKSSITGESAKDLVAAYEKASGRQWVQTLGYTYALFEVALAALKSAADPTSRDAIRDAIANLNLQTIVGPVNFKDTHIKNVSTTYLAGGQWRKAKSGPYPYDLLVVNNKLAPVIPTESDLKLLSQLT